MRNHRNPSVMRHNFSQVPSVGIRRSVFSRSHTHKTTFDSGYLIPIYLDEALPGDTFAMNCTSVARLATPIVPFMDNLHLDLFFFAVPLRLVWSNFVKMMGEQVDPGDSTDYTMPVLTSPGSVSFLNSSIYDYFGFPIGVAETGDRDYTCLPFRAYNLIWNEWFRDENLQDSVDVPTDDGPDGTTEYQLLKRGKRHDYFTSCLPWPQKGTAVDMPLGTVAPVYGDGNTLGVTDGYDNFAFENVTTYGTTTYTGGYGQSLPYLNSATGSVAPAGRSLGIVESGTSGLYADLSGATAATINSLREAFQLQKLMERDARGGTRYIELVKSHFGVTSPDFRMQRPEYLGGNSTRIDITPIPQTSESGTTKQGHLAAVGYHQQQRAGFHKSFVEHSYIIGLACVWADLTYQQGIDRMWYRSTKWDFYWPALQGLGEQEVLNREIYYQGTSADDDVFGYQERWAEYRYKNSLISGKLRSAATGTLDYWHLSQEFGSLPTLGNTFIQETPPVDRVVAVTSEPELVMDCYFDLKCARPMPVYSVPGFIDHF